MANPTVTSRALGGRRTEKIAETVARQILRDIQHQGLAPGTMLPSESAMLERFDIGRGSLREALRILEVNGLVTIKTGPGGGPVVAPHDPRNFGQMATLHLQSIGATYRELLDARLEYETLLARKAAEQPGAEAGEAVRAAMDASSSANGDDSRYASIATSFHATVCSAAGNPVLALAANSIQSIWSVRVTSVLYSPEDRPLVFRQHEAITRAIEKHDARRAERLMREHMEHYKEYCEARYPARMDDVVDWS
ncbi:MAG TPA: FCD domain-containing protein [Jatrophihabitans sp.]|jgi:DNA-binding FadR family transcriptional regulator